MRTDLAEPDGPDMERELASVMYRAERLATEFNSALNAWHRRFIADLFAVAIASDIRAARWRHRRAFPPPLYVDGYAYRRRRQARARRRR